MGSLGKIDAPLGSRTVRAIPLGNAETVAMRSLEEWMGQHPGAWVALSGGKDSTVVAHMARRINPTIPIVFYNSGAEFPQTLTYLERLGQEWGGIVTIDADPDLITWCQQEGFLTRTHTGGKQRASIALHRVLIEQPEAKARALLGCDWNLLGLRAEESIGRRIGLTRTRGHLTRHTADGEFISGSYCPIWSWMPSQVHSYLATHHIPPNPLYQAMERLGVPPDMARMSLMVDGTLLTQGRWALAYQLAPTRAREIEHLLPALRNLR